MSWHWKELVPIDSYTVQVKVPISDLDMKVLLLLYQPLISSSSVSLYMTLWSKLELDRFQSDASTHHELMLLLKMDLDHLVEARKRLEGVGLLRTFSKESNEGRQLVYELQEPMGPAQFFEDDVLSVFLFNCVGKEKYREYRARFAIPELVHGPSEEKTASFDEAFQSLHHSELVNDPEIYEEGTLVKRRSSQQKISFTEESFDFDLLKTDLPSFFESEKALTTSVQEIIKRLAFVYRVDELAMSAQLQKSLDSDGTIDVSSLRKHVQNWYRFEQSHEPPALGYKKRDPNKQNHQVTSADTEEEKMLQYFEETPPITLLQSISGGAHVPLSDARLVESLLVDFQLAPGVANVLVDYVMKTNNMKLDPSFVQKIAGHWSRKKLKTAAEAMKLAKEEHEKRKQMAGRGKEAQQPKKNQRKEQLPKWMTEKQEELSPEEKSEKAERTAQEKKKFEALLQKYQNTNERKEG
ncbi:replication initiation and membrane attachment family protein [Salsuginibacillus kocurii]|uniref:replication initiation and membrane attachment family protein n=1 Tax=Salsuginibacillus kocurii TaxID=427078 RepID=UPI00037DF414|nr:DnaD domain protein [Salsuginibacillus kocurii]